MDKTITTPHGALIIRPAVEEDALSYRELRLEALRNHPEAFSADYETNRAKPTSFWAERLRANNPDMPVMTYFAIHADKLIGMCSIVYANSPKTRHTSTIVGMYVRPEWRGLHVAERLIDACIEWASTQEIILVKLAVVTTNAPAIRCYARSGFQVYGIEPQALHLNDRYYDELLMACEI
jgi:RimJ/RimL family protein N-acetyltransferase